MSYKIQFHTKWADFDANKHMRHSAYNDYAAEARIRLLKDNGFGVDVMETHNIGPMLFSENTVFKREIKMGEDIQVELFLEAASKKLERFKIMHYIYREDGILSATVSCYIAWLDLRKRKLTVPPKNIFLSFDKLEKLPNFEEIIITKK